jgi:two-component system chemotaxis sensor kinase CheA
MSFRPEELQEILSIYKAETEEHLQRLNDGLLHLEQSPRRSEALEEIFREAHSLKGAARMIGFETVEKIAHGLEDLFGLAKRGDLELGAEVFDVIFSALDAVGRLTEQWLNNPDAPPAPVEELLARIQAARQPRPAEAPGPPPPPAAAPPAPVPAPPAAAEPVAPPPRPAAPVAPVAPVAPAAPTAPTAPTAAARTLEHALDVATETTAAVIGTGAESPIRQVEETIRVTTQKLDDLMNQIGEILVTKIKFDERLSEVRRLEHLLQEIHGQWLSVRRDLCPRGDEGGGRGELFHALTGRLGEFQEGFQRLLANFNEDNLRLTLVSSELQDSINRVRMLPLSALFNLFPRLLRDIARQEGKDVELVIEGGQAHLDKKIIEELKDPLMHLMRNALDHGIETPEVRLRQGKPATGHLRLTAAQKASSVVIEIEDDGAGIDLERVKSIALRRGFVSEAELPDLTDQQVLALIFRPGFSTKGIITDLSGRGVGLDVVLTNIERLKGTITVTSEPGHGSVFSIRLPITLATTQALLVRVAGQVFAIPLGAVGLIGEVGLEEVTTVESREAILVGGVPTALVRLHEVLRLADRAAPAEEGLRAPVVVLGSSEERIAFLVDELLGESEIVVKNLGPQLRRVRNVSGATILGDGSVVLILNVFDLIKSSQKVRGLWIAERRRVEAERRERSRILVVDDSVTTRMLEKNILEGSGYEVTLAVDGQDALEKLGAGTFDLVVSDVEMPRMNGFELTRQLRREEKHRELPVILVTSLSSEEDKKTGIDAGADAYITKGAFDQGNLISTIKQLL